MTTDPDNASAGADEQDELADSSSTAGGRYGTPDSGFRDPAPHSGTGDPGGPDPGDDAAFLDDNYPPVDTTLSDSYQAAGPDSTGIGSPGMGGTGLGRGTDLGGSPRLTGLDTMPGSYGSGGSDDQ